MQARHLAGVRLPIPMIERAAKVISDGRDLGLSEIPADRTALVVQALTAYLPVLEERVERRRRELGSLLLTNPVPTGEPAPRTPGALGALK